MTRLTSYDAAAPFVARGTWGDFAAIAEAVAVTGASLERWQASAPLDGSAGDADILVAFAQDIERLKARGGYLSHDVIRLTPDHPDRVLLRGKFRTEHTHDDDEVRFFVAGSGLFYIHHDGAVHALECTAGDLIMLPAGTRHWFDAGEFPGFTAIRLFTSRDGWVAKYTGAAIADAIPAYPGPDRPPPW